MAEEKLLTPLETLEIEEKEEETLEVEEEQVEYRAPALSYLKLFYLFLEFGLRAWGGPVAQINMIKQHLVIEGKWISMSKFNHILAVYQVLPGPEATELCCYFGMVSRGRLGSIVAGLGFILPGFIFMLLLSWIYVKYGIESAFVQASFRSVQPTISAMIFRAVHRLGEDSFTANDNTFDQLLFITAGLSAVQSVMHINFFITLLWAGIFYLLLKLEKRWSYIAASGITLLGLFIYILYVSLVGFPKELDIGAGLVSNSPGGLFLLGLLAGLLTFGGAYTAIPLVRQSAVVLGQWITNQQFLDGLALSSIVPAPLIIFSTFVGFVGGGFLGALLMTIGVFLPAFSFTLVGHNMLEKVINIKSIHTFLDGVTAGVIGLIAITAFSLLKSSIIDPIAVVLFIMALVILYRFTYKITNIIVILAAATVGPVLYVNE